MNILQNFVQSVRLYPDKTAVVDKKGTRSISISQLDLCSRKIATLIRQKQDKDGIYVPIVLSESCEYLMAILGVWFSGNAFVALDSSFPSQRLAFVVKDCNAKFCIDDSFIEEAMKCAPMEGFIDSEPKSPAALFYTSGSTGNPKGIIHTRESFDNCLLRTQHIIKFNENDIFANNAPFYFVASSFMLASLAYSVTIHLLPSDIRRDVLKLEEYVSDNKITIIHISPSVLPFFRSDSDSLRLVLTGSEKVVKIDKRKYDIVNLYGMTETFPATIFFYIDGHYENAPIGKPAPTITVHILDENGNQVKEGEEGELCLEGILTPGYINNPEKNEELYKGGVLHTNDIVKMMPDGNLQYVNRKDWMMKINGQRVEPGEIESVVKSINGIKDAVVKGFSTEESRQYLCCYYIENKPITEDYIREALSKYVASYMMPSFFVKMDSFPLNQNGKLDRKSLLPPERKDLQSEYVAPRNEMENELCCAFAQTLKIEKVGINDDFFLLGGDSIRIMALQKQCKNLPLTSKLIYKGRTPMQIAMLCEGQPVKAVEKSLEVYPLSKTQMGIYIECMNRVGEVCYNNPRLFTLDSDIDMEHFARALESVVDAHPYIKTRIEMGQNGDIYQRNCLDMPYTQTIETFDNIDLIKPLLVQPFILNQDALFRFRLIKTKSSNYFFMDFHHIIFDGSSFVVFIDDLNKAYSGEVLTPEALNGFDIAFEENRIRQTAVYDEAKKWYEETFNGISTDSLPLPDQKEEIEGFRKMQRTLTLSSEVLKSFCNKLKITENVYFTTVFSYLLASYSNSSDSLFSTIYNGRTDLRSDSTIAMLVKTLPVYHLFEGDNSIKNHLTATKEQLLGCMNHDIFSFAEVCDFFGISSQLLFAYQGDIEYSDSLCGNPMQMENLLENATGETLAMQIFKQDNRYLLELQFDSSQYSDLFMGQLSESFDVIANEFLVKKELSQVSITSQSQISLLDSFHSPLLSFDRTQTVISLFREQAVKTPDHLAVVCNDFKYTYGELDRISERIGKYLKSKGLGREQIVSVLVGRSQYMVIASLGILKAGCAYQPLDPSYPSERLNFMIGDSKAALLIADEELIGMVNDYKGEVILTKNLENLPDLPTELEDPKPEDLFVLLYTSGSTGVPKGCMLEHRNVLATSQWFVNYFHITSDDNSGAYTSYGFDVNLQDLYPALISGVTIHIIGNDIRFDLIALNKYFLENNITYTLMTTQVGRQLALSGEETSLHHLIVGGEKLVPLIPPEKFTLYNAYGPSECTVCSTIYPVTKYEKNIPIGKALNNLKLFVVDKKGNRQPVGAIGELWISGLQVSRGYLNRPEMTEKVYLKNPFCSEPGFDRVYRTGDVVRYLPDGNIEFIGRKDSQVKIRGFRIELTEVEAIIRDFPGIKDATVQAFDEEGGGKFLAAYIVSDIQIDIQALNDFILENKPPYIVPAVTMQIEKIPLNQNQKVNKKALPKPENRIEKLSETNDNRPMNILEEELTEIIAGVVNTKDFGITTPLGYLGLTSISAIKLATLIYKKFGVSVDSKSLVKRGSLQEIENQVLKVLLSSPDTKGQEEKKNVQRKRSYPLTYSQTGVYYECMKRPSEITYNIPFKIKFPSQITSAQLHDAVIRLIEAHSYIMTHFEAVGDNIEQVFTTHDVEVKESEMSEEELANYKMKFVKPFNLGKGPLYRAEVVKTENSLYLLVDFHHLVFDGASCDIFINELTSLLENNTLETESYTYFDYIDDEVRAEASSAYKEAGHFFDGMLKECEGASEIPADLNNQPEEGLLEEYVRCVNKDSVNTFCRANGITPANLFLSAAFYAISRYVNNKRIYISTISNGRADMSISNTFGMFVKTLPLASSIGEQTVMEFVKESALTLENSIKYEKYPFAKLSARYNFVPEIMFAYQVGVVNSYSLFNQPLELEGLEPNSPKFKLSIHIEERGSEMCIVLQYNNALYSSSLMEGFASAMATALENFVKNPEKQIKRISIVCDSQFELIRKFREEGGGTVPVTLFHNGVELMAKKYPNKRALVAVDNTYSYEQMNYQMNRIAHALIDMGIKPRTRIALLLPRNGNLILSMFGVMKAGAAYIPCDPEYPSERIKYILEDSQAAFIITTPDRISEFEKGKAIDVNSLLLNEDTTNPDVKISSADIAYLIYTSGSTGRPKGVILHHAGICNYLYDSPVNTHVHALATDATTLVSVTTISFDMSLKEIGTSLFNGLTLVLASEDQANNPILLSELMEKNCVDAINATPSRMLQYMELPDFCNALSRCKVIMSGGEKYADTLLSRLHLITKSRIFNTYGPTEITVSSNCKELTHTNTISIGRPLFNYKEFIVDTDGNELPIGVVGELCIGGVGVAKGYNNMEEATAEHFVDYQNIRVYKSGDYAKWSQEGDVIILGRKDNQVKLRGLRIELSEIEACIAKVEDITNSVVMIRTLNGREHICAYFTAENEIDVSMLKEELKRSLAAYMVPTAYMQMKRMPLTQNGKIDTKELPEPQLLISTKQEEAVDNIEQFFCDIFAKILELEKVGATDNFFDLGGTSLVVTRIIIEASKGGYTIVYGDVFTNPTPRRLAALVRKADSDYNDTDWISQYDYQLLDSVLQANTIENFKNGQKQELGNVLLTGAVGFLGIHILKELLDTQQGTIYCLLRGKGKITAENRLKSMFFYYFEDSYEELFGNRIIVEEGDVTRPESFMRLLGKPINTIINCAANVKHFSKGTDIEDVNIGGVKNAIYYCLKKGARLVQVSTMSVNGLSVDGYPKYGTPMTEQTLYFGQFIDNKYVNSKFYAERLILENIKNSGLSAKIMRVGNLSARHSDGEFQINFSTNSFMGRLKSYAMLGKCPYEQLDSTVEFSPIDEVSKAIILLARTPKECCIFHPFNPHSELLGDIFAQMRNLHFSIDAVETQEFNRILLEAESNPDKAKILSSMIAYQNLAHGKLSLPNVKNNKYTMQILYRMGYQWPTTSWDYIRKFLSALQSLGYFDII